jgi:hypothetical protein
MPSGLPTRSLRAASPWAEWGRQGLLAVALAAALLGGAGCDLSDPVSRQELVVEAFLRTGETLPSVVLRQTQPLSGPADTAGAAVRTARVALTLDGTTYAYRPSAEHPGRYVPRDSGVVVPEGVPFRWRIEWRGRTVGAGGRTPPPVAIDSICVNVPDEPSRAILLDSLRRDSLDIPAEQGYIYPIDVTVRWATAEPETWVRGELQPTADFSSRVVNFFLQPAEVKRERNYAGTAAQRVWRGVYAVPVSGAGDPLPRHRLTVALTRGDDDFADFATSRRDPDRREPISNVDGALGIATAVAVDSLGFAVAPGTPECQIAGAR